VIAIESDQKTKTLIVERRKIMEYRKSSLSNPVKRHIKAKEKDLDRTCRKIWDFTNPNGETFLFGSFCKNRDRLIVTIAHKNDAVNGGWMPEY
jgi:hypothetical protein